MKIVTLGKYIIYIILYISIPKLLSFDIIAVIFNSFWPHVVRSEKDCQNKMLYTVFLNIQSVVPKPVAKLANGYNLLYFATNLCKE